MNGFRARLLPLMAGPWLRVVALALMTGVAGCDRGSPAGERPLQRFTIADSLQREGRWAEAAEAFRGLRDSLVHTTDTAALWRAQHGWADALSRLGKSDSARMAIDTALRLAGPDPYREGQTRYLLSIWFDRQGQFDSALVQARRALELAEVIGNPRLEASAYNALGRIYSLMGQNREALRVHERYIALQREIGHPQDVALALNEIGIDYRHFGRFEEAIAAYEEALEIYRRLDNPRRLAMVLFNLGNIHLDTGESERARELFQESLGYAEEIGHVRGQGFLHNSLAQIYADAGNLSAARRHLERAYAINRDAGLAYSIAQSQEALGRLELRAGRLAAAKAWLDSARILADSAGFGREQVSVREALARLAVRQGDGASALELATSAAAIADSLFAPTAQYEALLARALALESLGSESAASGYLEAIELLESWRGRLTLGDLRLGVTEPRLAVYEGAIRTSLATGAIAAAFDVSERARARLLLEILAERGRASDSLRGTERYRQRLHELSRAWEDASPDERARLEAQLQELGDSLALLQSRARRADPASVARYPAPAGLAEIRTALTATDRGLLTYFWGEEEVYGWWVGHDTLVGMRLGRADSLGATVRFLRSAVEFSGGDLAWEAAARRAYESFVGPLVDGLPPHVLVVSDGPLAYIPFEVFIPPHEDVPLGATRRLVYGPSGSILTGLRRSSGRGDWEREALIVAGPDFDDRQDLPPLPHADREGRDIRGLFPEADLLTGARASPDVWLEQHPARYRYLHFATHALIDDRRPDETHLVMSGGRLALPRIRSLELETELVTLSACETALGRRIRGEGVIGLPHAFLAAGARGVVVSLWRVRDRRTAEFMARFYRQLEAGALPADALWATRRTYIQSQDAHPSVWAPFILVGALSPRPQ